MEKERALSMQIIGEIIRLNRLHKERVEEFVSAHDLQPSQHRMLLKIGKMGDKICQKDISNEMGITPAAVAVTLKKLAKLELVEKIMSEEDNRFNFVCLTEKGKQLIQESKDIFDGNDEKVFVGFSEEEMKLYLSFLNRSVENLEKAD